MCFVGLERLAYFFVVYSLGVLVFFVLGLLGLWLSRSVFLVAGVGLYLLFIFGFFFWVFKFWVL